MGASVLSAAKVRAEIETCLEGVEDDLLRAWASESARGVSNFHRDYARGKFSALAALVYHLFGEWMNFREFEHHVATAHDVGQPLHGYYEDCRYCEGLRRQFPELREVRP